MVSSARQILTCIVVALSSAVCIQAQTTPQKVASASVSGKVTIKGKPAVGVTILATDPRSGSYPMMRRHRARTDQTGTYRITNLRAGTYEISATTLSLVPTGQLLSVVVSESEEINDADISLAPGGVITGKITDSEGEPVIGIPVNLTPLYEQLPTGLSQMLVMRLHSTENSTDDRGVYRAFGLPPGKYKVSVGQSGSGMRVSRDYYKETFYPSVTDAAKATVIELKEGSEIDRVDIVVGRPARTFTVAGRVVDAADQPIANIKYGVGQRFGDAQSGGSSSSIGGEVTNANGEFRLENVTPGKYTIFTVPPDGSGLPSASVTFDVSDRDITDLLIRAIKGSRLSGVVVLDGNERDTKVLRGLQVYALVASPESDLANSPASAVGPDGSFSINGVRSGRARLGIHSFGDNRKEFQIVRIEHNGVPQSETINVKAQEDVAGIRVIVKYLKLTGAIRGQVKVEDGELPPISRLSLLLWPLDETLEPKPTSSIPRPELDARGRFFVEGLPAGVYRLSVHVYASEPTVGRNLIANEKTEQVTVTDDAVTEVTLILKPRPNPN